MDLTGLPLAFGAFKAGERHDGLVLRAYEPTGRAGSARLSPADGWRFTAELNLLEDVIGELAFDFRSHQIRTWRLERQ